MASIEEINAAFGALVKGVQALTASRAISRGQQQVAELQEQELNEIEAREAQQRIAQQTGAEVFAATGGDPVRSAVAARLLAPPAIEPTELGLEAEEFMQPGLEEAGLAERKAAQQKRLRKEKLQDAGVKLLAQMNKKKLDEKITKDKDVVFESLRDTQTFMSSLADFESFTDKLEVDPTGFFRVPRQASVDRFAASVLGRKGLTEFIKSTSGAQVTDKEREFLQTVFPSLEQGALTRAQLKTALAIFRKGSVLNLASNIEVAETRGASPQQVELLNRRLQRLAAPLGLKGKSAREIIDELSAVDLSEGALTPGDRAPAGAPEGIGAGGGGGIDLRDILEPVRR